MGFDLLPHNQKAYDNVKTIFRKQSRAAVIHPTGTGKGRIARKLIEDNQDKKIIYFSPSLAINNSLEKSLKKHGINTENLEILTYQKLTRMSKDEIETLNAEYIILDEFHHCGAKEWGSLVNRVLNFNLQAKILGLSATPLRYTAIGVRDMAEELFGNVIASEMSLEASIAAGILNEPTYVTSLYAYEEIIENLEKQVEEYQEKGNERRIKRKELAKEELSKLKKYVHEAMTSLPDLLEQSMPNRSGKYIVFCSSIEDMKAKIEAAPELFKKVNSNINIRQVSSDENDVAKNEKTLQNFEDDKNPETLKLLFCVNMLNEGYHLNDLDGGIMMRSTASPTLYTQQFGRIVSAGKKGDTVLIDLVNNIDAIDNIVRFYDNLSKERNGEKHVNKTKKFTMTKQLRSVGEVVRKIESLVSRRSNNIEANFMKRLGISYDDAKEIIENGRDILNDGRKNNYDGEFTFDERETLDLFYDMRKLRIKMSSEFEVGTESYNKKAETYKNKRDEVIVKNMGLVKWMLKKVPELQNLDYGSEEDKEQAAMKYLIEAADTYNPQLRTRDKNSLRFDEYLLVFLQSGMTKEKRDIEYEKYTADILEVKAELESRYGKNSKITDYEIAKEMLRKTVKAIDGMQREFFKKHPFYNLLKDKVVDYREEIIKEEISWNRSRYNTGEKFTASEIRREVALDIGEYDPYLLKMTEFQIRNACRKMQVTDSYEATIDFDIQEYYFEDTEKVQPVGDGYVLDGVYIEKQEPYAREIQAEEAFSESMDRSERSFFKVDLEKALQRLTEKEQILLRLSYGIGLKKEDVEGGDKLLKKYVAIDNALRQMRHPDRRKFISSYAPPERALLSGRITKKTVTALNYKDTNGYAITSRDFESVKLSDIIKSDEIFNYLNESGLWSLNDLVSMTECQLKSELKCTDEMIDDIKQILEAYGVELSEEEQEDVIATDFLGKTQDQKAKILKSLMEKKKSQEEEIQELENEAHTEYDSGERED